MDMGSKESLKGVGVTGGTRRTLCLQGEAKGQGDGREGEPYHILLIKVRDSK